MAKEKADEKSNSTTNEPWKEPGQTSQDSSQQPTPNGVEQEKGKKSIRGGGLRGQDRQEDSLQDRRGRHL